MVVSIDKKTAMRMYVKVKEQMQRYLAKHNISVIKGEGRARERNNKEQIHKYEEHRYGGCCESKPK